jgi:uncharacterized repeat protein (TIGR03803 family)
MPNVRLFTLAVFILVIIAANSAVQAQSVSVLYNFGTNPGDPLNPTFSGIIAQGRDGNLYSTTPQGGTNGAAFKITPAGALTVLNNFVGTANGNYPTGGLTLGRDGNFYGTTQRGGTFGDGTVFQMTPSGTLTTLYNFTGGTDGKSPTAPPILGIDGSFYGTTPLTDNSSTSGSVYKIASGTFTVLYTFAGGGSGPLGPLVQGASGAFYGTTYGGFGNVFKITPSGDYTLLHVFDATRGLNPMDPLIQASDGNFYGTTIYGGAAGFGKVFKVTPGGQFQILHNFTGKPDGINPVGALVQATDGNLYGTTLFGPSTSGCGTIFSLGLDGTFKTVYTFPGDGTKGCTPQSALLQHTNGLLYGQTYAHGTGGGGVFFSLDASLPAFVSLLPYSGNVGRTIEALGQGFTGTTAVSFNGKRASFSVKSDTYLTATIPSGATTGFVTVTTPSGTLTSNKQFRVVP